VVTKRNASAELILDAIERAEQEMYDGGIVAVGDISNAVDTFATKQKGKLRYYTFVELFDFLQEAGAEKAMQDWTAVYEQLGAENGNQKSLVPHAPYSVSQNLFKAIRAYNAPVGQTISIHNQETPPENALFLEKTGAFLDFYSKFGISLDAFEATGKASIHYALAQLNPDQRNLFVHNTLSTREDVSAAHAWSPNCFWATCPNANLYIENRLPDYQVFLDTGAKVCIGTDSLTSNWQLSILEEMKAIARYQSYVPFAMLLRWATLHGAEALGFNELLGSLAPGKRPGLLLLQGLDEGLRLAHDAKVTRLTS
jgi:aminodeoxyfutalosine deaminase